MPTPKARAAVLGKVKIRPGGENNSDLAAVYDDKEIKAFQKKVNNSEKEAECDNARPSYKLYKSPVIPHSKPRKVIYIPKEEKVRVLLCT